MIKKFTEEFEKSAPAYIIQKTKKWGKEVTYVDAGSVKEYAKPGDIVVIAEGPVYIREA